jgi:hypothetical protein
MADSRQQTVDSLQQAADSKQQTVESRMQTADSRQCCYLMSDTAIQAVSVCFDVTYAQLFAPQLVSQYNVFFRLWVSHHRYLLVMKTFSIFGKICRFLLMPCPNMF